MDECHAALSCFHTSDTINKMKLPSIDRLRVNDL